MTSSSSTASTTATATAAGTPWVERYRPKTLDDISHQTEVVSTLQNAVATGRLPHLLLYGPPGSGKTSVALALCRQLWHPSQFKRRVLELNASDERGISVVREKIKQFASLSVGTGIPTTSSRNNSASARKKTQNFFAAAKRNDGNGDDGLMETTDENNRNDATTITAMEVDDMTYPNPPFKIIILDEADTVTGDAQAALRRIIEAHSRITRFILICNYVTRIIEPLASRCAKFRFQALPPASMKERLLSIAAAEGMMSTTTTTTDGKSKKNRNKLNDAQVDAILKVSGGDMRRAVTSLQSVHALVAGGDSEMVDEHVIAELAGLPSSNVIDDLYKALQSNRFDTMNAAVKNGIIAGGYSVQTVLQSLLEKFITSPDLDELGRAELSVRIAEAENNMNDGADEYLQLMTVCGLALQCLHRASLAKQ